MLEKGHLSDEAAALLVEAVRRKKMTDVPEQVLNHVETCMECKDKIIDVVTFLENPDSITAADLAKARVTHRRWYLGKIAAVFTAFAVLLGVYFFIMKDPFFLTRLSQSDEKSFQGEGTQHGTTDSTEIKNRTQKEHIPPDLKEQKKTNGTNGTTHVHKKNGSLPNSRYRLNPNLENMIGSQLRSALFEVSAPENNGVFTVPFGRILFSWKKEFLTPHTLKIVNNRNKVLYTSAIQGNSFEFTGRLDPGLYYWKIESKNELLYVGKFFIGNPPL
jgi:hypothetical protein